MTMRKPLILLLTALFSFACTLGPFVPVDTPTPADTQTDTPTPPPTETPVLPTQTFTLTPTLIGYKTITPTSEFTETPPFSPTVPVTLAVPDTATPPIRMEGFASVNISLNEIYKAKGCEPSVVRVTAQVANAVEAAYVLLFVRFKSLRAERAAKWTKIDMQPVGAGTFIHDLSSDQMLEDAYFETSWIEYQIVSTNQAGTEIGRTDIFKERLKMLECIPPTATMEP